MPSSALAVCRFETDVKQQQPAPHFTCSCMIALAVQGEGDTVTAIADESVAPGTITIESIEGDDGRLSLEADDNCVGIAARETLALAKREPSCGVKLRLIKGLPLGSGMGSSAASAAAACLAVNALFGKPLSKEELVYAGLQSEAFVSGYHADNIAPALLGGFVLVRCAAVSPDSGRPPASLVMIDSTRFLICVFCSRAVQCTSFAWYIVQWW